MEQIFAFFFKYRPFHFQEGEFLFQWQLEAWQLAVLSCSIILGVFLFYRRWLGRGLSRRWLFPGLKITFFLVILLLLMRPSLVLPRLVPRENILALLVDDSLSMGIPAGEQGRGEPIRALLTPNSSLRSALEKRFRLLQMGFSSGSRVLIQGTDLGWKGSRTDIAGALQDVLSRTENKALGGIILFSDGSDNVSQDFNGIISKLKARRVPVHAVGVGSAVLEPDLELSLVRIPRVLVPDTPTIAQVNLTVRGFQGRKTRLEVWEGNTLIQFQDLELPHSETAVIEVPMTLRSRGVRTYLFRVEPFEEETLKENNSRSTIIDVKEIENRILFVEGHPRWEYKFIRSAIAEDRYLRLESLLRTAINKYYRQGIDEESALASGFPSSRDELFSYQALVLGSVESSFFTYSQMEMIRDFVSKRGGGFLMLGGRTSFSAGEYQNTPVEEIMPVWMVAKESQNPDGVYQQGSGRVRLTPQGLRHPALQLDASETVNRRQWDKMPDLKDWNQVGELKPGATVLALIQNSLDKSELPLMVFQRYGHGLALGFLTGSSWRWQMLQEHQDRSHQNFWQQVLRWLAHTAKSPVEVETEREIYSRGEEVKVRGRVFDSSFNYVNSARIRATVISPVGSEREMELDWSPDEDGLYKGVAHAEEEGLYQVILEARGESEGEIITYGTGATYFVSQSGLREFYDANQKTEFLKWLARETGGHYYSLDSIDNLPEEVSYVESHTSVLEALELWDMPINFLVLSSLLLAEWGMRRRIGLI